MGGDNYNPEAERQYFFSEAEKLLAWLVEVGSGGDQDAQLLQQKRTQLQHLLQGLGVWDSDKGKVNTWQWQDLACRLYDSKQVAIVPGGFPSEVEFTQALKDIEAKLPEEVYQDISPRMGLSEEGYIRSVAAVMANKLVYETVFENDPIKIDSNGHPQNGRHRWLALEVLKELHHDISSWTWVSIENE